MVMVSLESNRALTKTVCKKTFHPFTPGQTQFFTIVFYFLFSLLLMLCSRLPLLLAHFNLFLAMGPVTATVSQLYAYFLSVATVFLQPLFFPIPHPSQKIAQCYSVTESSAHRDNYFPSLLSNRGQQSPDPSQLIQSFPLLHDWRIPLFRDLQLPLPTKTLLRRKQLEHPCPALSIVSEVGMSFPCGLCKSFLPL